MKESAGGDNLAVGWLKPGEIGTVPSEVIPGSVLSPSVIKSVEVSEIHPVISASDTKLLVYPNPLTNDELNIKVENLTSEATLKIFTVSGVECYEELIQNSGIIHIDRNIFKSGIYIIKVYNEFFVKTTKLIVN